MVDPRTQPPTDKSVGLSRVEVRAHLGRLGIGSSVAPTPETLVLLQVLHLRTVPFENASVRFREPIALERRPSWTRSPGADGAGSALE